MMTVSISIWMSLISTHRRGCYCLLSSRYDIVCINIEDRFKVCLSFTAILKKQVRRMQMSDVKWCFKRYLHSYKICRKNMIIHDVIKRHNSLLVYYSNMARSWTLRSLMSWLCVKQNGEKGDLQQTAPTYVAERSNSLSFYLNCDRRLIWSR
jgi:hypothetical protein